MATDSDRAKLQEALGELQCVDLVLDNLKAPTTAVAGAAGASPIDGLDSAKRQDLTRADRIVAAVQRAEGGVYNEVNDPELVAEVRRLKLELRVERWGDSSLVTQLLNALHPLVTRARAQLQQLSEVPIVGEMALTFTIDEIQRAIEISDAAIERRAVEEEECQSPE